MNTTSCRLLVVAGLATLACSGFSQLFEALEGLGGSTYGFARAITPNGKFCVGTSQRGDNLIRAVRWNGDRPTQIPNLPGGRQSQGYDLSGDGSVVAGMAYDADQVSHPFRWTASGGILDLGSFGGAFGFANAISRDGSVVAGFSSDAKGKARAFRWTSEQGMVEVGDLGGGISYAYDCSEDGSVVVGNARQADGAYRAYRWESVTGAVSLGTLAGENNSFAYGISPDGGVVVGLAYAIDGIQTAFRSYGNSIKRLDRLVFRGASKANAASRYGRTIVGQAVGADFEYHAVIWEGGTVLSIDSAFASFIPNGWKLETATGVSPDGRFIVGYGRNADGNYQGWKLDRGA